MLCVGFVGEIGEDAVRKNGVIYMFVDGNVRGLRTVQFACVREDFACGIDERFRVVRAADRDAVAGKEIEIRTRAAADLKDSFPGGKLQQIPHLRVLREE